MSYFWLNSAGKDYESWDDGWKVSLKFFLGGGVMRGVYLVWVDKDLFGDTRVMLRDEEE